MIDIREEYGPEWRQDRQWRRISHKAEEEKQSMKNMKKKKTDY